MARCSNCGWNIRERSRYCAQCGARVGSNDALLGCLVIAGIIAAIVLISILA